eukprot:scaffold65728_cov25-Tisochrysis_lutea.AAC.1
MGQLQAYGCFTICRPFAGIAALNKLLAAFSSCRYKLLGKAYPYMARRLLTDPAPELRGSFEDLMLKNGQFRRALMLLQVPYAYTEGMLCFDTFCLQAPPLRAVRYSILTRALHCIHVTNCPCVGSPHNPHIAAPRVGGGGGSGAGVSSTLLQLRCVIYHMPGRYPGSQISRVPFETLVPKGC